MHRVARVALSAAKVVVLLVLHLVLFAAGSAFFVGDALPAAPPTPEESLQQVLALVAIAFLDVGLLVALAARSRLRGWRLAVLLVGSFYFVKTFTSMIEAAWFMKNVTPTLLPSLFAMTLPVSLVVPALAAWMFGGARQRGEPAWHLPSMSLGELLLKVGVLGAVVYPAFFFGFGYFVAWQNPAVREFYGSATHLGFLPHMAETLTASPLLLPFEAMRGLLWVGCAVALLATSRAPWWRSGLVVALFFALVQNDVHFISNPLMPGEVRFWHFWETAVSNALFVGVITWMLSGSRKTRAFSTATG